MTFAPFVLGVLLAALGPSAPPASLRFQEPAPAAQEPTADADSQLPLLDDVVVEGAAGREAEILEAIRTRAGSRFDPRALREDMAWLWKYRRIRVDEALLRPTGEAGHAVLVLRVVPFRAFRRVVIEGNEAFEREELENRAGLYGQALDVSAIPIVLRRIEEYYRSEGYAHVQLDWQVDREKDEVRIVVEEGPRVRIAEVEFEGNEAIPSGGRFHPGLDLWDALANKPGFFIMKDSPFSEERVREDANALVQLYRDYGFFDVVVEPVTEYLDEGRSRVRVVYRIEEGPQYHVRRVLIRPASGEELLYPREELLAELRIAPGQPFEASRLDASVAALTTYYGERGHPALARTEADSARAAQYFQVRGNGDRLRPGPGLSFAEDAPEVDVVFELQQGQPKRIRDVVIRGLQRTRDAVARREIDSMPGDLADQDLADRSSRRLVGLGYFRGEDRIPFVRWRWKDVGQDEWVEQLWDIKDSGSTGQFRIGGAWNSDNGPSLILDLKKQNFDLTDLPSSPGATIEEIINGEAFTGAGQTLSLGLRPGTRLSTYFVQFVEPDLLGEHVDRLGLTLTAMKRQRFYGLYDEERDNTGFRLGRRFGRFFTVFGGASVGSVLVDEVDPGAPAELLAQQGRFGQNSFTLGTRYDTVEDRFSPLDGFSVGLSFDKVGGFMGGDFDYLAGTLSGEKFFPLWKDSLNRHWVLALRGRLRQGWAQGGTTSLPYTERFYLGGLNTLRGFDYRGVGQNAQGFFEGGDAAWDGGIELRFPLVSSRQRGMVDEYEWIRGAFFVDAGAFGDDFGSLEPVRIGAGVGIRMRLPFMPLVPFTLDFGWPLRSEEFDDTQVFSFTLGTF